MRRFSRLLVLASSLGFLGGCGNGSGSISGGSPPAATQFSVSGPASSGAGFAFTFTVTAQDSAHNVVTSYAGTVHFDRQRSDWRNLDTKTFKPRNIR